MNFFSVGTRADLKAQNLAIEEAKKAVRSINSPLLMINGEWKEYEGTTGARKLYYRAMSAHKAGSQHFWVYDIPGNRATGICMHPNFRDSMPVSAIDGVALANLPQKLVLSIPETKKEVMKPKHQVRAADIPAHPLFSHDVYLIGSLRNPEVQNLQAKLRQGGLSAYADWMAVGPEADDHWRDHYKGLGLTYQKALREPASVQTFEFDVSHMKASSAIVLVSPCGKSGHLELGWATGIGKPTAILLDDPDRWDVMYQFADLVTDDYEELSKWLRAVC